MPTLPVIEIFRSIQGESTRAGRVCTFVRLAGCNLDCCWCDSGYAAKGDGDQFEVPQIISKVADLETNLVEITGGEPLVYSDTDLLVSALCDKGFEVLVETNGSIDIGNFDRRAGFIIDYKLKGSGHESSFDEKNFTRLDKNDELKFVISDKKDFDEAIALVVNRNLEEICPLTFSPAFGLIDPAELAGLVISSGLEIRFGLPLHKYIWNPDRRGV